MKTLILYSTRHGATRQVARQLAGEISGCSLHDIKDTPPPPLLDYHRILLGSSLTAGQIGRPLKRWIARHSGELMQKQLALFLCGMDGSQEADYLSANFSAELLAHAKAKAFLGGIYNPQDCGLLTRILLKHAVGLSAYTDTVDTQRIRRFACQVVG